MSLEFIQSLQKTKPAQLAWSQASLEERHAALLIAQNALKEHGAEISTTEAADQSLSQEFVQTVTLQRAHQVFKDVFKQTENPAQGTGIISVILPHGLSLRFAIEMIVPALAAGNAVMVKTSSRSQKTGEHLKTIFKNFPEGLVTVLNGSRETVGELFTSHPSIKAVAFSGQTISAEKIAKSAITTMKKMKLYINGSNSALILDGADLDKVAEQLCESCFAGAGSLRESVSKILVLESKTQEFMDAFQKAAEKYPHSSGDRLASLIQQVPADQGKIAWGSKDSAAIVKDLSHCSVMQQDALNAPIAIVSSVKYQHEMLKWANTGYLGVCAQVFGPEDKALKVAEKLEVGKVYINSWLRDDPSLGWGQKSSVYGIEDSSVFGGFFSERKFFVGVR